MKIKFDRRFILPLAISLAVLAAVIIVALVMNLNKNDNKTVQKPAVSQEDTKEPTQEEQNTEPIVNHDNDMISYLTGEWISKDIGTKRPIAIMLNNIKEGTPQNGISKAGVVYEAPVEGGLTRLMGVFEDYEGIERIGSVRSARTYFIYFASEFDAFYMHFGQAWTAESTLKNKNVQAISGLSGVGTTAFWRSTDRKAPHNVFTNAEKIAAGIEYLKYDTAYEAGHVAHFQFADEKETVNLENGTDAKLVKPGYSINKPWFEYNEQEGVYYRFQYGDKQIDECTGEQIKYKNIIMQNCSNSVYEGSSYLNFNLTSGGEGKYITNGKAIDITWKKTGGDFGQTKYYAADGQEIVLNPGKTWVCIIQNSKADEVVISAE